MERRYEFYVQVARTISVFTHEMLLLPLKHKICISELTCNVFLSYRHTDDGIFDNSPNISGNFLKISEDSPKLVHSTI